MIKLKAKILINFFFLIKNCLFLSLWKIIGLDFCHLNDIAILLLLHSIVYDSGKNIFWAILEHEFKSPNWKTRMQAGINNNKF